MRKMLLGAVMAAGMTASSALAVPSLQLGIVGGTYDDASDTVIASASTFQLAAYGVTPNGDGSAIDVTDTYYISAALICKDENGDFKPVTTGGDHGSFTFNGTTVNVTSDMIFGVPPIEADLDHQGQDLPQHGVFETFFKEFSFQFDPTQTSANVNTELDPGFDPTANAGDALYYELFNVDVSNLDEDCAIHFDLYSITTDGENSVINIFAPFSHDAQSGETGDTTDDTTDDTTGEEDRDDENPPTTGGEPIPEPVTATLSVVALAGLGLAASRRK